MMLGRLPRVPSPRTQPTFIIRVYALPRRGTTMSHLRLRSVSGSVLSRAMHITPDADYDAQHIIMIVFGTQWHRNLRPGVAVECSMRQCAGGFLARSAQPNPQPSGLGASSEPEEVLRSVFLGHIRSRSRVAGTRTEASDPAFRLSDATSLVYTSPLSLSNPRMPSGSRQWRLSSSPREHLHASRRES